MGALTQLFSQLHWYDLLDILVVTSIVVWLYSWVKGTRAFRVLLGLGLVVVVYAWAQSVGFLLTSWALQWLGQAILIFVIVIFAPEIRQVLEQLNPLRLWNRPQEGNVSYLDEIVSALEYLRTHRIGAILILEGSDPVAEHVRPGVQFEGRVQNEILVSIFQPESPLHDGAALIRDGIIREVGVFLPISQSEIPAYYGSRHRAGVGISEVTDALVLVVSEERGEVSLIQEGEIQRVDDLTTLTSRLQKKLRPRIEVPRPTWRSVFLKEWKVKLVTLFFATSIWFVIASQQQGEQIFSAPIRFTNLPAGYAVISPQDPKASVRIRGLRRTLSGLGPEALEVRLDLSHVQAGTQPIALRLDQVVTPPEVFVIDVDPQILEIQIESSKTNGG